MIIPPTDGPTIPPNCHLRLISALALGRSSWFTSLGKIASWLGRFSPLKAAKIAAITKIKITLGFSWSELIKRIEVAIRVPNSVNQIIFFRSR